MKSDCDTRDGEKSGIISGSQVWLQQSGEWRIVSTQRSDLVAKPVMRLPEPAKPNTQLYPDPERAPAEIASALAAATKDHKRVLLVFGGNWCYDCHVLDATFHSKAIAPLVNENYHVVHVNVGDYDKNLDLAKKYEIPLEKGVPSLAILDPDGNLVVSQKKGEFESTVRIGPEDVVAVPETVEASRERKWIGQFRYGSRRRMNHSVPFRLRSAPFYLHFAGPDLTNTTNLVVI